MRRALLVLIALASAASASAQQFGPTQGAPFSAATSSTPFVASNGGSSAASVSARFSHVINVVDDFGAKGDGTTDDWAAIQKAEGMNSSGLCGYAQPTLVIVPPTSANVYRISQAIRRCPWVTLWVQSNATTIKSTGDASGTDYTGASNLNQWPTNGLTLSGYVSAGSNLPALALTGSAAIGATSVMLASSANASKLVVGDLVDVETTAGYSYGGFEPSSVKMALVTAANASTGVVTLDRALDFAASGLQLRKLTNGAGTSGWPTQSPQGLAFAASHHSAVIGGRWVAGGASPWYQPFDGGGGCLDCVTDVDEIVAGFGAGYGNLFQDNLFRVRREQIFTTAFEHAYHSSGNRTEIGDIDETGTPNTLPPSGWAIGFDEGSHDNRLTVGRIEDYNGDVTAEWLLTGTVAGAGGDALTLTLFTPAALGAAVNAAGSGYTTSAQGTMTWSGSGCTINPVLAVSTTSGGAMSSVNSIVTPGQCSTLPSSSATSWTPGGGLASSGSGASFTLTGTPSVTASYTTVSGDTLSTAASALASALNGNSTFTGAGFAATANQANAGAGSVIVSDSNAGVPFTLTGTYANAVVGYNPLHDVVKIFDSARNRVDIGAVTGGAISGYALEISGGTASNEPATSGNDVTISQSNLTWQNGDVSISGAGASGNVVRDGWYHGATFQPKAFWLQYNAGSFNELTHLSSDDPSGYPWCDVADMTNSLVDVYAPLTPPRTTGTYDVTLPSSNCRMERVSSAAIRRFLGYHADFGAAGANSSGGIYMSTTSPLAAVEAGDGVHIAAHLNLTGTSGAKAGSIAYFCASLNWSFASTVTGAADLTMDCSHPFVNNTFCALRTISSAGVTLTSATSYCTFGQPYGAGITVNSTTGSDVTSVQSATVTPYAPTYAAGAARE